MPTGTGWGSIADLARRLPQQDHVWVEARRRFRLSHTSIGIACRVWPRTQMATIRSSSDMSTPVTVTVTPSTEVSNGMFR
jgi:hypothetical protein